jgi:hypothetical protein
VKFPVIPEAGVVDEKIDLELFGGEPVGQAAARSAVKTRTSRCG